MALIVRDVERVERRREVVAERQNVAQDIGDARFGIVHPQRRRDFFPRVLKQTKVSVR